MNILCFDTSLNKTYIALLAGGKKYFKSVESDEKNYHSAYLIKEIKNILQCADIQMSNLDAIATNIGPGSFTGIRVGVTVAKVIASELKIKAVGIKSVNILKEAFKDLNPAVVLDARRGQFYLYDSLVCESTEIKLVKYEETYEILKDKNIVCDASSFEHLLNNNIENVLNYENQNTNLGESLLTLALNELENDSEKILKDKDMPLKKSEINSKFNPMLLNPAYIQPPPIHGR